MRANTTKNKPKRAYFLPRCRCTKEERATIETKAAEAGLSLSEYQRRALIDAAVIVREPVADARLISQLSAIGNNLNQLARNEHIHNEADTAKMRELLKAIDLIIMGVVCDSQG